MVSRRSAGNFLGEVFCSCAALVIKLPSCATVCCTTLRPQRTKRTSRQYTCVLPSLRRVVCRRYTLAKSHSPASADKILSRHYIHFSPDCSCDFNAGLDIPTTWCGDSADLFAEKFFIRR